MPSPDRPSVNPKLGYCIQIIFCVCFLGLNVFFSLIAYPGFRTDTRFNYAPFALMMSHGTISILTLVCVLIRMCAFGHIGDDKLPLPLKVYQYVIITLANLLWIWGIIVLASRHDSKMLKIDYNDIYLLLLYWVLCLALFYGLVLSALCGVYSSARWLAKKERAAAAAGMQRHQV